MKKRILLIGIVSLIIFSGIAHGQEINPKLETPKKTFKTLVTAIKAKDLDVYILCWSTERAESEGMVSKLREKPKSWEELQGIFKGPQKLTDVQYYSDGENERFSTKVKAPKGNGGGIGKLTMMKENDGWKMYSW